MAPVSYRGSVKIPINASFIMYPVGFWTLRMLWIIPYNTMLINELDHRVNLPMISWPLNILNFVDQSISLR